MRHTQAAALLMAHGVDWRINGAGRLQALECCTVRTETGAVIGCDTWRDVHGWSKSELLAWLGY